MIYLTKKQLEEIAQQLAAISVKDTDFDLAVDLNYDDIVAIVQNGINKKISIETLREGIARDGKDGEDGAPGKSAYQLACEQGYVGTLDEWLNSLHGEDGESAYEVWRDNGHPDGTVQDYLDDIKGEPGATGQQGPAGPGVPAGGSAGQVLAKSSGSDYATEWVTPQSGSDLDALRDWTNYDGTDADQVLGSNLGKAMKDDIDAMLDGYIFKGVASTNTNPGTVTKKTAYLAGAGTYSNFTSGGTAITVPEGNIGVLTWNNGWSVSLLAVGSGGGGGGLNYEIITASEYATKQSAGTLDDVLYIIIDTDSPLSM